jgi:hypothetical protein
MSGKEIHTSNEEDKRVSRSGDSTSLESEKSQNDMKKGFGGCLLYPLFLLIVQPIAFIKAMDTTTNYSYAARYEVFWPYMIYDILLLVAVIVLLVLFWKKIKDLPAMYVLFLVGFSILSTLSANLFWRFPEARVQKDPMLGQFVMLFQALLLVPYFVLDDRVRNTFVNDLDEQSLLGAIVRPFVPLSKRLYSWLKGLEKKVFVFAFLFVIASVLLGFAVDSIVLYGFID